MTNAAWGAIAMTMSQVMELQAQQTELLKKLINFLMDEERKYATEADEKVVECLPESIW